jgi:carbon monoxide dehydrogenase subunit G
VELKHEFEIGRPTAEVWEKLLDLRNVATALPGASVDDVESDGTHHGTLRMKLGSFTAAFRGTARYTELDGDERRVRLVAQGSSTQGQAAIELDGQALPGSRPESTRVQLVSRVVLSGRIANFGATLASDVARQVLDQFVVNLTRSFEAGGAPEAGPATTPPTTTTPTTTSGASADALDLGSVLVPSWLTRPVSLPVAVALALAALLLGRSLRRSAPPSCTIVLPPPTGGTTR